MKEYKVKTYEDAMVVIKELGLLPLAPLLPDYPSLTSITAKESWHSETEFDPWIWRTKFSVDGVAGYGKFIKKKSVLVSREILPFVKKVLGYDESVEERYFSGQVSKEAFNLYTIISQTDRIDTRLLRAKSGLKDKKDKKVFENALLELQGTFDIVISGIQEKTNVDGEKNGWSSMAFETYGSWSRRNHIENVDKDKEAAKEFLLTHFSKVCSEDAVNKLSKIFK